MNSKRINNETSTVNEVTGLKENTRIADYSVFFCYLEFLFYKVSDFYFTISLKCTFYEYFNSCLDLPAIA